MSLVPAQNEILLIFEGSTLDESWVSYENDVIAPGNETDWTGWTSEAMVRETFDGSPLLTIPSLVAVTPGPTEIGVALGMIAGQIRLYVGSDHTAALDKASFEEKRDEEGNLYWQGRWDLEIIDPDTNERHRYLMGPVLFSPEVTRV